MATSTDGQQGGAGAPVATFGGPLTGGLGIALLTGGSGPGLAERGYTEAEYTASGTATSYRGDLPEDGLFELVPDGSADYTTRVVVRRPADPAAFNGTVVVEWFNVSAGGDVAPDYTYLLDEITRRGYAYVGVSAQRIGIEGGPILVSASVDAAPEATEGLGQGIKANDPARYGDLVHPGDAFSYDLFTQIGRAVRSPGALDPLDPLDPLDGLVVERLIAVGESQSAFMLSTYVNGVQPLVRVYDAFLIHSRGGAVAPLGRPGEGIDLAASLAGPPTVIRADIEAPTIIVETETDVLGGLDYLAARQPDNGRLRVWEIAGTAHADSYQVGPFAELLGCADPINRGQQSFVVKAALRHLDDWLRDGTPAPAADRLTVDLQASGPAFVADELGNVVGGVRTPAVDVAVDVLSGFCSPGASLLCQLFGSTHPIPHEDLRARYPSADDYLAAYEKAASAAIDAGFVLVEDRDELLADARPARVAD